MVCKPEVYFISFYYFNTGINFEGPQINVREDTYIL